VITVNVQGLASQPAKLRSLYKSLAKSPLTLAILTESNLSPSLLSSPSHAPPQSLQAFTSRDPVKVLGSGVTVVASSCITISDFSELIPGFLVQFTFSTPSITALVFGVYSAPNDVPLATKIVECVTEALQASAVSHYLLLGDLNATFRLIDRSPFFLSRHDMLWRDFLNHTAFCDTIDHFRPSTPVYTFTTRTSQSRLDHILVSPSLVPSLVSSVVRGGALKRGDHYAVEVKLRPSVPSAFTSSVPRTPTQDIRDTPFCVEAQRLLNSFKVPANASLSSRVAWSHFLSVIHTLSLFATNYTRDKSNRTRRFISRLERRLAAARDCPPSSPRAQYFASESVLNSHLAQYEEDLRARRAFLLNKVVGFDADECDHTTRILTSQRINDVDRYATSLLDPKTGVHVRSTTGMLGAARAFYDQLLGVQTPAPQPPSQGDFLPSLMGLASVQQQSLLCDVSRKEARATIGALKSRKAPGPDGVPNDLFKAFADLLVPHLQPVLQAFLTDPWLPPEVQGAVIGPLYKGDGDRRDLVNWRPISLVNTTYKLVALFLMRRLNPLMSSLVLPGQSNAVPGRTTFDNVHCARLAQFAAQRQEVDVSFAFVDCTKAFDRVEWPFLWATLAAMRIPPEFISCIRALYTDASACVRINGFLSSPFSLGRGVRQGCPLSPLLYVLSLEPVRHFINSLMDDRPLTWLPPGFPASLAHADDLVFLCWSDLMLPYLSRIQLYASARLHSGFLVNVRKTYILYLRKDSIPSEHTLAQHGTPYQCHFWPDDHGKKHLGLAIGGRNTAQAGVRTARDRCRKKLQVFGPCTLPALAKARLLVPRYAGCLQYYAQAAQVPQSSLKELSLEATRAYWGPFSKHKFFVRHSRLQFPLDLGGVGLIHPPTWFDAFHRVCLLRLTQGVLRPCDNKDDPPALSDPALIMLFKFLVKLVAPQYSFDPATFFWQPADVRKTIAAHFPPYWCEVLAYFEREIAYLHNISRAARESRPEFQDIPYAVSFLEVPFPGATDQAKADLADAASATLRDARPWAALLSQPAYMVPLAIDPGPRKRASRRSLSRKQGGGPVRYHYQLIQITRMNSNPWEFSAESDWVDEYPALQGDPNAPDVDGGRIGMPPHTKDRLQRMLRFCRGKRYNYVLSHAWILFQARLQPSYWPCPWCGQHFSASVTHFKRFSHVAWSCPVFQRHWSALRPRAGIRSITSLTDLALGLAPDGSVRISSQVRRAGITLHAAIWRCLSGSSTVHPRTYDSALTYYQHLLDMPDFFEEEVQPVDPPYFRDLQSPGASDD
jgi:Reverse transcriptase (RNA-dependent DNA polymerase)/Endonuclease/Exonuclease/phosphatase family